MTEPRLSWRLVCWLTGRNLFAPRTRGQAMIVSAVVGLCVTTILVPLVLAQASRRSHEADLRRRPLVIWAGDRAITGPVKQLGLALLGRELDRRLGDRAAGVRQIPFYEVSYEWVEAESARNVSRAFWGRTISPDDPLWARMTLVRGEPLREGEIGVVVSAEMLRRLTGGDDRVPAELRLRSPVTGMGRAVPLRCVIAERELPSGHDFALTEEFDRQLRSESPDLPTRIVWTGPVDRSWQDLDKLPQPGRDTLKQTFDVLKFRWPPVPEKRGNGVVWRLRASDEPLLLSEWVQAVRRLRDALRELQLPVEADFTKIDAPEVRVPAVEERPFDRLGLWVEDPSLLPLVVDAARAAGLPVHEAVVAQVQESADQVQRLQRATLHISAGMAGIVSLILFFVFRARVLQRAQLLGMLTAMGAGRGLVLAVYLAESVALCAIGLLLGGGFAAFASLALAGYFIPGATPSMVLAWPGWLIGGVASGTALVSLLSTLTATWTIARWPPILLLLHKTN